MPIDADDPRLTAYALGELDDPAEIAEIEASLAESGDLRQYVDEIRATGDLLAGHLKAEPVPGLRVAHLDAIEGQLAPATIGPRPWWTSSLFRLAVAASLLVGVGGLLLSTVRRSKERSAELAVKNHIAELQKKVPDSLVATSAPTDLAYAPVADQAGDVFANRSTADLELTPGPYGYADQKPQAAGPAESPNRSRCRRRSLS
jgi:hypothetical protein